MRARPVPVGWQSVELARDVYSAGAQVARLATGPRTRGLEDSSPFVLAACSQRRSMPAAEPGTLYYGQINGRRTAAVLVRTPTENAPVYLLAVPPEDPSEPRIRQVQDGAGEMVPIVLVAVELNRLRGLRLTEPRTGLVATWGQGSVEFHFGANDFFAAPMNGVRSARRFGASRVLRSTFGNSILAVTLRAVGTQNGIITEYSEV